MTFLAVLKRVLPFFAGFAVGAVPLWIIGYGSTTISQLESSVLSPVPVFRGSGKSSCKTSNPDLRTGSETVDKSGLRILSKPRPGYTHDAREGNVEGTVLLRVTFLASGQIGAVQTIKGLPDGLTEEAVAAARRITFEPAKRDGVPMSVTKNVEYSFSIY
jgi:TonB family protein